MILSRSLLASLLLVATLHAGLGPMALAADDAVVLHGAGATFPEPLYRRWIELYRDQTGGRIIYDAIGSGGGIDAVKAGSVDFGGTDAFLSDDDLAALPSPIVHIPTCVGAVVVTYNLPGAPDLRMTPEVIADIFLGRITNWADPRIASLNPAITLPDLDITVIHRSDASGTTFLFTSYLSRISPDWRDRVGAAKLVRWVTGMGVDGNNMVASFVKRVPGAVSYVESTFAQTENLPAAAIRNRSGRFVAPTLEAISAAAQVNLPPDTRLLITDSSAENAYPIAGFTYIILFQDLARDNRPPDKARALVDFLHWCLREGQSFNADVHYAPLPDEAVDRADAILHSVQFDGQVLLAPHSAQLAESNGNAPE